MLTTDGLLRFCELGSLFALTRWPGLVIEILVYWLSRRLRDQFAVRRNNHKATGTNSELFVAASCERWERYSVQLCTAMFLTIIGAVLLFIAESAMHDAFSSTIESGAKVFQGGQLMGVLSGARLSLLDLQVIIWVVLLGVKGRSLGMASAVYRDMKKANV